MSHSILIQTGILLDYKEIADNYFVEYWELNNAIYECHWFPLSTSIHPTTIIKK